MAGPLRVRESLEALQSKYESGDTEPLETLWRAWRGIKDLPVTDSRSFFKLASMHGAPLRGAGFANSEYWGGYCNHGNVLFPTWHRVYLLKLEEALRSVPDCAKVTLPYWNETSVQSINGGIPWALTRKDVVLDGVTIANPLRSYVLQANVNDFVEGDEANFSKSAGYETKRYPLSGLEGTAKDLDETKRHNAQFTDYDHTVELLNANVVNWLTQKVTRADGTAISSGRVAELYRRSLAAPNYTVFSNNTSAQAHNGDLPPGVLPAISLERPHDAIHLAIGGFDVPKAHLSPITGANGDMGENDTASYDPIFYFHHCFIDRLFWLWQQHHSSTSVLDIIPEYPGTNSVDGQGPPPGVAPNSWLGLDSPLSTFVGDFDGQRRNYTSSDCIDIEEQLGYTYTADEAPTPPSPAFAVDQGPVAIVSNIDRTPIRGSFTISVFADVAGQRTHLGTQAVLSRWNVKNCANCQTHLRVAAYIDIPDAASNLSASAALASASYDVKIYSRDGDMTPSTTAETALASATTAGDRPPYRLEIR